ncbi:MAG: Crp/Fnr family transcriptional regulator [Chloroflexi bacterium]|nr:Crp/Fnr family transcriptional regulator [Chloroflexota bacterium]OJV88240.1 MAG: hypothetical protein BGO39_08620 [Chloroflexi bacterium 54-19]
MSHFTLPYYPTENHLFAALSKEDYQKFLPYLEPVMLPLGKFLYQPGIKPDYVYFPTTAVVSILYTAEEGVSTGVGIIGNEGMVGLSLFLGGPGPTCQALVQNSGSAIRLKDRLLQQELDLGGGFHRILLRYTQAFITQITQTAVCNRFHTIEQRVCRWLLLSHDRVKGDHLEMTQQVMGNLAGGHREGVALAAERMQAAGLIHYCRGHLTILDRKALEARACECYAVVKAEYDRLPGNSINRDLLQLGLISQFNNI